MFLVSVIKHKSKGGSGGKIDDIEVAKPTEDELYHFREDSGKLENLAPDHPINTDAYKKKLQIEGNVTCFAFYNVDEMTQFMFSGYGDGLICCWNVNSLLPSEESPPSYPYIGHTNKINHLEAVEGLNKLFSCSNDCTLRQWSLENHGQCERIFKFADPVYTCKMHFEKNMIFTGSWDRQIRAIDYTTGVVDRAFLAANSAIKTLHIHENWLFSGSCES